MKCQIFIVMAIFAFFQLSISRISAQEQQGNLPWGVDRVRGDLPWDADHNLVVDPDKSAGEGVVVAVLDTGIWPYHPDLIGHVTNGVSFVEGEVWYEDFRGHGTWVAGTIAAMDNGNHLIGVAPEVILLAVKVVDRNGGIDPNDVAAGINWAVNMNADIIVISLSTGNRPTVRDAVNNAYNAGKLLFAPSGNTGHHSIEYPAAYDSVVAVGATDQEDEREIYSNYGPELDLVAPGATINTTNSNWFHPELYGLYYRATGTSFAVPHVAGVAALLLSSKLDRGTEVSPSYDFNGNGRWDNNEVIQKLIDTTLDLGSRGFDEYFGNGLVNAWYSSQRPQGDIDYNLFVDMRDLSLVAYYLTYTPENPNWRLARPSDINIDNIVNSIDLGIVGNYIWQVDP